MTMPSPANTASWSFESAEALCVIGGHRSAEALDPGGFRPFIAVGRLYGGPPVRDTSRMRPGDTIGDRFEIAWLAGAGGMGEVYRARDRRGDDVAIKVLHHARDTARFTREAQV